jgi:radical SAM/Cys-rich protein
MNNSKFHTAILSSQKEPLKAIDVSTLQVNIGYRCNLACKHCHIEAGSSRTETMDRQTMDLVLIALANSGISTLDITGGAPELNPHFRYLAAEARKLGRRVIVRTNLSVFFEEGMTGLPEFFRDHDVELVASLPYYREDNVDRVRGTGTFNKCISALQKLNGLGYGGPEGKTLSLVYNPPGAFLAPDQKSLEIDYKKELKARFAIDFTRLYTFANMPIGRFRDFLVRTQNLDKYMDKLVCAFNPATLDNIMCKHLVSVGWDGRMYDCDFNQVLGMSVNSGAPAHIRDFDCSALSCTARYYRGRPLFRLHRRSGLDLNRVSDRAGSCLLNEHQLKCREHKNVFRCNEILRERR